jgi:hypothetical protein
MLKTEAAIVNVFRLIGAPLLALLPLTGEYDELKGSVSELSYSKAGKFGLLSGIPKLGEL